MPINERSIDRPNLNTIYVAESGGGKNQAMYFNLVNDPEIKRAVIWDPHNLFDCLACSDLGELAAAMIANIGNTEFKIRYNGNDSLKCIDMFCKIVWELLDCDHITYVLIDELADSTDSIAKSSAYLGKLMRGGRKFGARIHCTAVSASEISKTVWKQCPIKWIGIAGDQSDIDRAKKVLFIDDELMNELKPLQFWVKDKDREVKKVIVNYVKPPFII